LTGPVCERLCAYYSEQVDMHWSALRKLVSEEPGLAQADVRFVERQIAHAQRKDLLVLVQRGLLSQDIYEEFSREIQDELSETYQEDWKPPAAVRLEGSSLPGLPEQAANPDGGAAGG
jgi:hypothetical protein